MEQVGEGSWLINRMAFLLSKHMLDVLIMAITPTSIHNCIIYLFSCYSLSPSPSHHPATGDQRPVSSGPDRGSPMAGGCVISDDSNS